MTTTADLRAGEGPFDGPLPASLAAAADVLREAAGLAQWQVPDVDILDGIRRVSTIRGQVEALYLDLVRELDGRGLATASPVATTPEGFLRTTCLLGAGQARRDVAAARTTASGEPLASFAVELSEGRRTRAHVDVAVRCLDRLPADVLARPGAPADLLAYLRLAADDASPLDMERAVRQLLARVDPEGSEQRDGFDVKGHTRRFLDIHTDATGMVVGSFQLDAVAGATLRAALATGSAPEPGADGEPDRRQPRQRRADALTAVAETALGVSLPRRGERPRVVVHVTPAQLADTRAGLGRLEDGEPVAVGTLRRLVCDAVLQRVVGTPSLGPLDVGREHRLVTLAQRRALAARDGGCVVPGCGAPPDWCDAHHVVHWADGGPSDLENYALLCPSHHTAVHAGTWQVEVVEGQVMVTPPRWVDPCRTPRPAHHQSVERTIHALFGDAEPATRTARDGPDETENVFGDSVPSSRPARDGPDETENVFGDSVPSSRPARDGPDETENLFGGPGPGTAPAADGRGDVRGGAGVLFRPVRLDRASAPL